MEDAQGREGMELKYIELARLRPNPLNPRREWGDLAALAESIASVGLRSPLTVRPGLDGTFVVVAGHRRLRAIEEHECCSRIVRVPCLVEREGEQGEAVSLAADNSQRVDFSGTEKAAIVQAMLELGVDEDKAAKASGCDGNSVATMGRAVKRIAGRRGPKPTLDFFAARCIDDFADDEEAVESMLAAYEEDPQGGISKRYWALVREREAARRRESNERRVAESGAAAMEWDAYRELLDSGEAKTYLPGIGRVGEDGCGCDGFCAAINPDDGCVTWFCRKPGNHVMRDEAVQRRERLKERMRERLRFAFGLVAGGGGELGRESAEDIARRVYETAFRGAVEAKAAELGFGSGWKPKPSAVWVLHAFMLAEMEDERDRWPDFASGLQPYNKERLIPRYDAWAGYLLDLEGAGRRLGDEERREVRDVLDRLGAYADAGDGEDGDSDDGEDGSEEGDDDA